MYPICLLEKFRKNDMKLGQAILVLIHGSLWESTNWSMEDITLRFAIIPDQGGAFPH